MPRHYAVSYDISDDKRRTAVFKTLRGYGDHVQFSVSFCDLSRADLARLRTELRDLIHHDEDQVIIIDLGKASRPITESLETIGRGYQPSVRTIVV